MGKYLSGKVKKGRIVKEEPIIQCKLGFDLVTGFLGHRAQDV